MHIIVETDSNRGSLCPWRNWGIGTSCLPDGFQKIWNGSTEHYLIWNSRRFISQSASGHSIFKAPVPPLRRRSFVFGCHYYNPKSMVPSRKSDQSWLFPFDNKGDIFSLSQLYIFRLYTLLRFIYYLIVISMLKTNSPTAQITYFAFTNVTH